MTVTYKQHILATTVAYVLVLASPIVHAADPATSMGKGSPSSADNLTGIKWRVVELSGHPVAMPLHGEQPFILFDQVKRQAAGYAGCNRFFVGYSLEGDALTFGLIGATKMACPDLEEGLETEFFKVLDATRGWEIVDGTLRLLNGDAVLARLVNRLLDEASR